MTSALQTDHSPLGVQRHLLAVHRRLLAADTHDLTPRQRSSRARHLRRLHRYALRGRFPRNDSHPQPTPVFVDAYGTHCAVGHLMHRAGRDDLVRLVVETDNNVHVQDLEGGPMVAWLKQEGFSQEEGAAIQPAYGCGHIGCTAGGGTSEPLMAPWFIAAWLGALLLAEVAVSVWRSKALGGAWAARRGSHMAWSAAAFLTVAAGGAAWGLAAWGPLGS